MKRLAAAVAALLLVLVVVIAVRTARYGAPQPPAAAADPFRPLPGATGRLAGAVRIPTVSHDDPANRAGRDVPALHAYLASSFPRVHAAARREVVGGESLLFTWPGTDPSLPPLLLMGHLDVVPVEPGTERAWTHPPFSGAVADGFVWGRGTLDDKQSVLGTLEAAEALLAEGFRPRRTVLLAFGADEEASGLRGARAIAALLKARGVRPWMVVDEGGIVARGIVPGVARPVALVGIAEKGYATVELVARGEGGHSSMPPRHTAAGRVARAVARLEAEPMPARVGEVTDRFLAHAGPKMGAPLRAVFANRWLFGPLVRGKLASAPSSDATIRTTTAATMLEGGPKENVLPGRARAVVNFRLVPGDRVADVLSHVQRVVDDPAVRVRVLGTPAEPSPVSRTGSPGWDALGRSVRQVFPDAVVAPYLVVGATDARWFRDLSPDVYRFTPTVLESADLARVHGTDERISTRGYDDAVRFYAQLLRNAAR